MHDYLKKKINSGVDDWDIIEDQLFEFNTETNCYDNTYIMLSANIKCDACRYAICPKYILLEPLEDNTFTLHQHDKNMWTPRMQQQTIRDWLYSYESDYFICERDNDCLVVINHFDYWLKYHKNDDKVFNIPKQISGYYVEDSNEKIFLPDITKLNEPLDLKSILKFFAIVRRTSRNTMKLWQNKIFQLKQRKLKEVQGLPQCWVFDIIGFGEVKLYEENGFKFKMDEKDEKRLGTIISNINQTYKEIDRVNELLLSINNQLKSADRRLIQRKTRIRSTKKDALEKQHIELINKMTNLQNKIDKFYSSMAQIKKSTYMKKTSGLNTINDLIESIENDSRFRGDGIKEIINMSLNATNTKNKLYNIYNNDLNTTIKSLIRPWGSWRGIWPNKETRIRLLYKTLSRREYNDLNRIKLHVQYTITGFNRVFKQNNWFIDLSLKENISVESLALLMEQMPWYSEWVDETKCSIINGKFKYSQFEIISCGKSLKNFSGSVREFLDFDDWMDNEDEIIEIDESDEDAMKMVENISGKDGTLKSVPIVFDLLKIPGWMISKYGDYNSEIWNMYKNLSSSSTPRGIPLEISFNGKEYPAILPIHDKDNETFAQELVNRVSPKHWAKAIVAEYTKLDTGKHTYSHGIWMNKAYKHRYWATKNESTYEEEKLFKRFQTPLVYLDNLLEKKDMLFSGLNINKKISLEEKQFLEHLDEKYDYRKIYYVTDFEKGGNAGTGWASPKELFGTEDVLKDLNGKEKNAKNLIAYEQIHENMLSPYDNMLKPLENKNIKFPDTTEHSIQLKLFVDKTLQEGFINMSIINVNEKFSDAEKSYGATLNSVNYAWKSRNVLPEKEYNVLKMNEALEIDKNWPNYLSAMSQNILNTLFVEAKTASGQPVIEYVHPDGDVEPKPFLTQHPEDLNKSMYEIDYVASAAMVYRNNSCSYEFIHLNVDRYIVHEGVKFGPVDPRSTIVLSDKYAEHSDIIVSETPFKTRFVYQCITDKPIDLIEMGFKNAIIIPNCTNQEKMIHQYFQYTYGIDKSRYCKSMETNEHQRYNKCVWDQKGFNKGFVKQNYSIKSRLMSPRCVYKNEYGKVFVFVKGCFKFSEAEERLFSDSENYATTETDSDMTEYDSDSSDLWSGLTENRLQARMDLLQIKF